MGHNLYFKETNQKMYHTCRPEYTLNNFAAAAVLCNEMQMLKLECTIKFKSEQKYFWSYTCLSMFHLVLTAGTDINFK